MIAPRRYVEEPERIFPRVFLDDGPFAQALGAFIIVCTDFVPIAREHKLIFLAKRNIQAAQGIWRFGGRQLPGETMQGSCARLANREIKLHIAPERFTWFLQTEELFSYRAQEPHDSGVHDLINLHTVALSDDELAHAALQLDPKEYDPPFGIRGFSREQLIKGVGDGSIRPQLLDMYDAIFPV